MSPDFKLISASDILAKNSGKQRPFLHVPAFKVRPVSAHRGYCAALKTNDRKSRI